MMQKQPIRRRKFRGRVGLGKSCSRCSARHQKCDALIPCGNCLKADVLCSLAGPLFRPPSLLRGNRAIYRHLATVQSWAQDDPARAWWLDFVYPAAQIDDTIFHALSCLAMVIRLPLADAMRFAIPPQAIEHYCQSLTKPLVDVDLLLLKTGIYIDVEARLAHIQNIENLFRSAFAIIHSTCSSWKPDKNAQMCLCLRDMTETLFTNPVGPTCVPREHWKTALTFMLRAAAEMSELDTKYSISLHAEVTNIMYDLNFSYDPVLEYRIRAWKQRFSRFSRMAAVSKMRSTNSIELMHYIFEQYEMALNSYHWRIHRSEEHGKLVRDRMIQEVEEIEALPDTSSTRSARSLDVGLIPRSLIAIYHTRDQEIADRLIRCLALYKKIIVYYDRLIEYFHQLVRTPFSQPTSLELEVFGNDRPQVLQVWQHERLVQYLAKPR